MAQSRRRLEEVVTQYDRLCAKLEEVSAELIVKYEDELEELRANRDKVSAKFRALEDADEGSWAEAKTAFSHASDDFRLDLADMLSIFVHGADEEAEDYDD